MGNSCSRTPTKMLRKSGLSLRETRAPQDSSRLAADGRASFKDALQEGQSTPRERSSSSTSSIYFSCDDGNDNQDQGNRRRTLQRVNKSKSVYVVTGRKSQAHLCNA